MWHHDMGTSAFAGAIAIDPIGDALAAGAVQTSNFSSDFTAVKLAGDTGDEVWRTTVGG